jgi:hypothetical protein
LFVRAWPYVASPSTGAPGGSGIRRSMGRWDARQRSWSARASRCVASFLNESQREPRVQARVRARERESTRRAPRGAVATARVRHAHTVASRGVRERKREREGARDALREAQSRWRTLARIHTPSHHVASLTLVF